MWSVMPGSVDQLRKLSRVLRLGGRPFSWTGRSGSAQKVGSRYDRERRTDVEQNVELSRNVIMGKDSTGILLSIMHLSWLHPGQVISACIRGIGQ